MDQELPNHLGLLFRSNERTSHYALIKNFERLVSCQLTWRGHLLFICKKCFLYFDGQPTRLGLKVAELLKEHQRYWSAHVSLRTDVLKQKEIRFLHFELTQRTRFTIYADFGHALVPHDANQPLNQISTVQPPAWNSAIARVSWQHSASEPNDVRNIHVLYAYANYVRKDQRDADNGDCVDDDATITTFSKLCLYRGEELEQHLIKSVRGDVQKITEVLYGRRILSYPPQLTEQEEMSFHQATTCHICKKDCIPNASAKNIKVRDQ